MACNVNKMNNLKKNKKKKHKTCALKHLSPCEFGCRLKRKKKNSTHSIIPYVKGGEPVTLQLAKHAGNGQLEAHWFPGPAL